MTDRAASSRLSHDFGQHHVARLLDTADKHSRLAVEEARKWGGKHATTARYHMAVALTAILKIPAVRLQEHASRSAMAMHAFPFVGAAALKCTTSLSTVFWNG